MRTESIGIGGFIAWALALVFAIVAVVAASRPVAHCHGGSCHAHVAGGR